MPAHGLCADVDGYEIGGKTGTAEKIVSGRYSNQKKINTFASVFPITSPEFVLVVILDEPTASLDAESAEIAIEFLKKIK